MPFHTIVEVAHNPHVRDALIGFATAAAADYHTFTKFKRWGELTQFDWNVATYKWFIGAATGLIGGTGLTMLGW